MTRSKVETDTKLRFGNLTLDRATFELTSPSGSCLLANKEFQLMEPFLMNPLQIYSSERIMEKIWCFDSKINLSFFIVF